MVLLTLSGTFGEMIKDGDEWDGIKINGQIERFKGFQLPSLEENIPTVSLIMQGKDHH